MWSYSRVKTFEQCPFKFKLRYIDSVEAPEKDLAHDDPLLLGTCLHYGVEVGSVDKAIELYESKFWVNTFKHEVEKLKLEHWLTQLIPLFSSGQHETEVKDHTFIGYIDYMDNDGIFDFKYTNQKSFSEYNDGTQLMLYAYLSNQMDKPLYYVVVPKLYIRQKKSETESMFLNRVKETLEKSKILVQNVKYDQIKVNGLYDKVDEINHCSKFDRNESRLCDWCDYKKICHSVE